MKKTFLAACILAGASLHAQNANLDFKYAIKASNISTITTFNDKNYDYNMQFQERDWISPAASFLIKNKKNNFHEFEISGIGINERKQELTNSSTQPYLYETRKSSLSHISLQYQYIRNFLKNKNSRWMPWIGIGIAANYNLIRSVDKNDGNVYPSKSTNTVNELTFFGVITPGVSYNISKKFFASASIPIYALRSLSSFIDEKIDGQNNTNIQDNDFSIFPNIRSFKLSLGLKL